MRLSEIKSTFFVKYFRFSQFVEKDLVSDKRYKFFCISTLPLK